jgi:uncharacterized iron-regulated protein
MKHYYTSTILFLGFFLISSAIAAEKPAYQFYNAKGKNAKYSKLIKEAQKVDIILFGELHNNPISHWLQLELAKDLHAIIGDSLILGAEMFESDNALILQEYVSGIIRTRNFEAEAKVMAKL